MQRLKLLGTVSVLALALNTGAAHAATYSVSNEAELTAAIASANADGDASSTITLTDSFAIVGTGLPPVTKTLTIDTGAHRLTSTTNANWNVADGVNLTLTGDMIANPGRFVKDGDGTQILSGFNATSSNALQVEAGTLRIEGGSRLQGGSVGSDPALRVTGNSTLILSGAGTRFTTNLGAASSFLGGTGNGASFIIQDGAEYLTTLGLFIADTTNSTGTLHVTGTNSLFNGAAMYVRVGTGRVNIDAGGVIRSSQVGIGGFAVGNNIADHGGVGYITISGNGSLWENATYFHLLRGTLDVLDGGALTTGQMLLAQPANANAAVTVSGASSTLVTTAANDIEVGRDGNAALTIADGGAVTVRGGAGTVHIATRAGSSSTVNIGGASGQAAERAGTLDAELIQFGAGTGTFNFNHTNSDYSFTPTFSGEGTINHAGSGKTVLNTDNSSFTGVTNINAGTLAVNDVLGGTVNVNNGRLQGVGTLGTTTHEANGIIAPGNSIGTLTINGNYVGNGGLVEIESVLGDDSSATDLLRITGDTSGTGNVRIINVGGTGALTTEGIQVISVAGASDGVFSLNGNYVINGEQAVVGGAYAYQLYKGNHSGSDANGWYLRSELKPVDPVNPIDPTPPVTPPAPLYQPSVPIVEAYPHALLGLNGLNTLQQRVGNRFWAGNGNRVIAQGADAIQPYAAPEEAGVYADGNGVWGRIEGGHDRINSHFSTSDTDYNQNVFKMQAGVDGLLSEAANGSLIGGVFAQYVHGKTKTNSVYGDGEISTDGYGFGGTLTWYGNEGFYIDGQAQATWYESDLNSTRANLGVIGDNKGFGYAFSVESGKRFALTPEWSVTPQAQLVYSNVHFDSFTDVFGADVRLDKGDSLQGRLGITLDHENSWQNTNGLMNRAHVYGIANLYYEFLEGTRVDVAGVSFASQKDRLWGGLGVGGSYNWDNDRYSIYGEGLVNTSLADFGDSYSVKGNVGFRVKW